MANTYSISLVRTSTQYLTIADASQTGLDITGDFTLEAWIKLSSAPGANITYGIISKGDSTNGIVYTLTYRDTGGTKQLRAFFTDSTNSVSLSTYNVTLNTATWYHVAVSVDVSTQTWNFYVDGVEHAGTTTAGATSVKNGDGSFDIGRRSDGTTACFDGLIDEVRVWSVIRSQTEINNNKSIQIDTATNLVGSWHLDNALTDSSGNNNTLSNPNSAVFSTDVPFVGSSIKTINGLAYASVKTYDGLAVASVKSINGLS